MKARPPRRAGGTFDERADAPFRVLQNGSMYSTKGNIGGFVIGSDSLVAKNTLKEMLLSNDMIRFTYTPDGATTSTSEIYLGGNTYSSGTFLFGSMQLKVSRPDDTDGELYPYGNIGIRISVSGIASKKYLAMGSYSTAGNHALYIDKGDICGFRLKVRGVSADADLSTMDSVIFCAASSAITLTLPSDAEHGQIYFIRKIGSGNVTITGGTIYSSSGTAESQVVLKDAALAILIYDETNNIWTSNYCS
ncbi:MAG: hypothetical protein LUC24_00165, partial [Bacteroidales bacterium]|nr:hypothetical protein [Bacteroidales bacterium]